MNQLDTTNINHFTFKTEVLDFHVLGGITTFGLDRMRVTLKINRIEDKFYTLRNSIDLYNANAVEKFV